MPPRFQALQFWSADASNYLFNNFQSPALTPLFPPPSQTLPESPVGLWHFETSAFEVSPAPCQYAWCWLPSIDDSSRLLNGRRNPAMPLPPWVCDPKIWRTDDLHDFHLDPPWQKLQSSPRMVDLHWILGWSWMAAEKNKRDGNTNTI